MQRAAMARGLRVERGDGSSLASTGHAAAWLRPPGWDRYTVLTTSGRLVLERGTLREMAAAVAGYSRAAGR